MGHYSRFLVSTTDPFAATAHYFVDVTTTPELEQPHQLASFSYRVLRLHLYPSFVSDVYASTNNIFSYLPRKHENRACHTSCRGNPAWKDGRVWQWHTAAKSWPWRTSQPACRPVHLRSAAAVQNSIVGITSRTQPASIGAAAPKPQPRPRAGRLLH